MIKKYIHADHIVDDRFKRSESEYRYTVKDLTELEAKDLACSLMACVQDMMSAAWEVKEIGTKNGFV